MTVNGYNLLFSKFGLTRLLSKRMATANKDFAIAGVPCFADTFVQSGSSVLRKKLVLIIPAIAPPRNVSCKFNESNTKQLILNCKSI